MKIQNQVILRGSIAVHCQNFLGLRLAGSCEVINVWSKIQESIDPGD